MAIAHLCTRCGWDLARLRPVREPHYGLRLVFCPRCQQAAVRRRHPIWQEWRKFLRLDWTLSVLLVQCILALVLGTFTSVLVPCLMLTSVEELARDFGPFQRSPYHEPDVQAFWWKCFWTFAVIGPVTGIWLRAGFGHTRWWRAWLGWAGFMLAIQIILASAIVVIGGMENVFNLQLQRTTVATRLNIAAMIYLLPASIVLTGIMLCALAGMPIGQALLWLFASGRRSRWRWRRRKRRLARAA